jgi:peptide/nickel transport system ATP-binding protein
MMENTILRVENLSVCYNTDKNGTPVVNDISFNLERGGSLGVIGESGSGKTSLAMAMMGLLKKPATVTGQIHYGDTDLNRLSEKERNCYRWGKIAIVFQNSLDVLNPVLTVYEQISECIHQHTGLKSQEAYKRVVRLLEMVGLEPSWSSYYPHQLSGGMRQRVLIAMALSCQPEVLIVDEPTTALDAVAKDEIIKLLLRLYKERKFALMVVSHEMQVIARLTSRIMVMYSGHIVEEGFTKDVLKNPMHPYTRGLIHASPAINPYRDLWGIPGEKGNSSTGQCPFYNRCNQKVEQCRTKVPQLEYVSVERRVACNRKGIVTLLRGEGLHKSFEFKGKTVKACESCDIEIRSGEVVVLIGESGSGKTTLAGILSGILPADKGEVLFEGEKVQGNSATCRKNGIQIVFQDPFSATNEHLTIRQVISEPLDILKLGTKVERAEKVKQALKDVQLPFDDEFIARKCYSLSGGQRQRVALARSLVMEPKLLIADEISSMLDPSTQANVLRLLKGLQNTKGFAMLYITHDLALAQKIADRVYVMYKGKIIEYGHAADIFESPKESYTSKLVQMIT